MSLFNSLILTFILIAQALHGQMLSQHPEVWPRLIVTTDIGQDPDDQQSLVRLLHYANAFQMEGIIVNSDQNYDREPPVLRDDIVHELIDAYAEIEPNLNRVLSGFHSANYLHGIVKRGCAGNGTEVPLEDYIGPGKDTEGSEWIIDVVERKDENPVCVAVWGGACDLAQALWTVSSTRTKEEADRFVSKLRVYFIGKQDSSNDWIIENYPGLWLILALDRGGDKWLSGYRGMFWGGDMSTTSREWLHENIISQNPLSAMYPDKTYTGGNDKNPYGAMKEGDSPSFLFFLQKGFNSIDHPEWGGWGGRFERIRNNFFRDASDTVYDSQTGGIANTARAGVFRWRDDFQKDFAFRCAAGAGKVTTLPSPPRMTINGVAASGIVPVEASIGDIIMVKFLDNTHDGQVSMRNECIYYPEPGTFCGELPIYSADENMFKIQIPSSAAGKQIHLVFRSMTGSEFSLPYYNRLILNVLLD